MKITHLRSQMDARPGAASAKMEWLLPCNGGNVLSTDCVIDWAVEKVMS